ncbi:MAG TPA: hypothetical protein VN368_03625 [Candidatus Methylomirabilis sp.]|nr:hypothetical protein [Candidatus Methylomirabilis sp.]
MNKQKKVLLAILGAVFFLSGIVFENISFMYLGMGTWLSSLIFYALYPGYKEITSLILGLLVLHAGVLLILKETYSNLKLLGFLVFTAGVVFVLNSGFSDYIRNRKK